MHETGFTMGIFDGLHAGHLHFFNQCLKFCATLEIGIMSDKWAERNKRAPLFCYDERCAAIENMKDYFSTKLSFQGVSVIKCDDLDPTKYMSNDCRLFFHGNDWFENKEAFDATLEQKHREALAKKEVTTIFIPYFKYLSSSEILRRARENKA